MRYFSKATNFHVSLGPFHCSELKKDPELWHRDIFRPEMAYLPWRRGLFDRKKIKFWSAFYSFLQNFWKKSLRSKVLTMHYFWTQNGSFTPDENFFRKTINTISLYLLAPFTEKYLKMNLELRCYVLWTQNVIWCPKWPICSEPEFQKIPRADPDSWSKVLYKNFAKLSVNS